MISVVYFLSVVPWNEGVWVMFSVLFIIVSERVKGYILQFGLHLSPMVEWHGWMILAAPAEMFSGADLFAGLFCVLCCRPSSSTLSSLMTRMFGWEHCK